MQEIRVQPEVKQEDPQYVQEMINKADSHAQAQTQEEGTQTQAEGALLAGKYKTEEELQKGILELLRKQGGDKSLEEIYKDLERNLGRPKEETPKETPEPEGNQKETPLQTDTTEFEAYEKEFIETGTLSEESFQKLEAKGLPRNVVETYLNGLKAMAEQQTQAIFNTVGGEANYQAMIQWAASNLTESEKTVFNEAVVGTPEQAKFAVEALYARYLKANGNPPQTTILGSGSGQSTVEVYESRAQLIEDMNDPRYKKDPAFRAKVHRKLQNSNIL